MYYCPECDETFTEPGNWNANTKRFLCVRCFTPLRDLLEETEEMDKKALELIEALKKKKEG